LILDNKTFYDKYLDGKFVWIKMERTRKWRNFLTVLARKE